MNDHPLTRIAEYEWDGDMMEPPRDKYKEAIEWFLNCAYEWECDEDGPLYAKVPERIFETLREKMR